MKRYALLFLSFTLTILVTACGGGGGGSKPESSPSPVPTTSAPASSSATTSALSSNPISSAQTSSESSSASSITSASSSEQIGPIGTLWHDNYALDFRNGVQLAHLDGSLPTQVTTSDEASIAVWPDGKQYVVTDWNVYDDYTDITVIDRTTGNTVYQEQVDYYLRDVSPSPTSKSLVKVRYGKDSISPFEEYILDFSTMKILYVIPEKDWFAWMPDGRFMLINIDTGKMRIVNLDTKQEIPAGDLKVPADRIIGDFSVSPTGTQFIMVMDRRGTTSPEPDLWIGNIDGTGFEQLTDTKLIAGANWSPDGRYVAYVTDTGSICNFGGCLGSCEQWYTPVNLRKVQGLPNTPGSEEFRINNRQGNQQILGCSVLAWTP